MTSIHQIKKLAGNLLFNQLLYPRDIFVSDSFVNQGEDASSFLESSLPNEASKFNFAIKWCTNHPGMVLDLANNSGKLALTLVNEEIAIASLDNSSLRITELRRARQILNLQKQNIFQIYPQQIHKFELDETYQTVFVSPRAIEQSQTELMILSTFRNILNHLKSEGSCFIEVHNLDFLDNRWGFRDDTWRYLPDNCAGSTKRRVWERTYQGEKESQTVFEYAISNNLNEFSIFKSTIHLFNIDQWMKLFEVAGFIIEDCFGDWLQNTVSSQLPQLVFHLKRR
ncbi:MAG: hypothetical protein EXR74_08070 [Bdellovibrionales bacterium]|nr:hypothetical protein [Bdellovibrionales bacterium]